MTNEKGSLIKGFYTDPEETSHEHEIEPGDLLKVSVNDPSSGISGTLRNPAWIKGGNNYVTLEIDEPEEESPGKTTIINTGYGSSKVRTTTRKVGPITENGNFLLDPEGEITTPSNLLQEYQEELEKAVKLYTRQEEVKSKHKDSSIFSYESPEKISQLLGESELGDLALDLAYSQEAGLGGLFEEAGFENPEKPKLGTQEIAKLLEYGGYQDAASEVLSYEHKQVPDEVYSVIDAGQEIELTVLSDKVKVEGIGDNKIKVTSGTEPEAPEYTVLARSRMFDEVPVLYQTQ